MSTSGKEHSRLGRGLASLMGENTNSSTDMAGVQSIPIEFLVPSQFQPRQAMEPQALEELIASVKLRGILQPLLARPDPVAPGRYQIIAGERRWRAAQGAGLPEIPVLVKSMSDLDALGAALIENLQREDLNAADEAEGYRRLIDDFKLTQEKLAEAVGKSRSHVANTVRLLNLPTPVLSALRDRSISAGHARALLAMVDPEAALQVVMQQGLNVRQTEALILNEPNGDKSTKSTTPRAVDPDLQALEASLSEALGLKVELASRGRRGTLKLHYETLDQLDSLIVRLSASVGVA